MTLMAITILLLLKVMENDVFKFLETAYADKSSITQGDLNALRSACKTMYALLKPMYTSGKFELIPSSFAAKRFFHKDKFIRPEIYFSFRHGVCQIEIHKKGKFFSVCTHDFKFNRVDDLSVALRTECTKFPYRYSDGWHIYGNFPPDKFCDCVSLYRFAVRCAVDKFFYDFDETTFVDQVGNDVSDALV